MKTSLMIFAGLVLLTAVGTMQADYPIDYTVEVKENCIKFEDAVFYDAGIDDYVDAGLGEEGVIETDMFIVVLDGTCDEIEFTIKAGKDKESGILMPGGTQENPNSIELCGFTVAAGPPAIVIGFGTEYGIIITSDDDNKTAALSHIELCFCEDTTVDNWAYFPNRDSPNTAPGVEEEEEEVDVD